MSRDNYWGSYGSGPRKVADGLKATTNLQGETWWSKRWLNLLASFDVDSRLSRGRSYAKKGQVIAINIEAGLVSAKVQGSQRTPYKITIRLKPLPQEEWEKILTAMSVQAIFAAKLLAGEMPKEIEEVFNTAHISLWPEKAKDLQTDCSCPDWSNPCKHIAAVYYILAEQFDADPFFIFKLRGQSKEEIIQGLKIRRNQGLNEATANEEIEEQAQVLSFGGETSQHTSLEKEYSEFWQIAGAPVEIPFFLEPPTVTGPLLIQLGALNLPESKEFSRWLNNIYANVGKLALQKSLVK